MLCHQLTEKHWLGQLPATHHSGYLLSFLLSYLITSLHFSEHLGLLLYRESHWVVTSSACHQPASVLCWYHPFICPLCLPSQKKFPFSTCAPNITLWTLAPHTMLSSDDGRHAWRACQVPINLKIEHAQPHKSPTACVSWYHELLVLSSNRVEGMRQREVSLWQALEPPDTGGGVMEHGNLLLGFTSCCRDMWIEISHLGEIEGVCKSGFQSGLFCLTSIFCKISKKLVWCRNTPKIGVISGLRATVTFILRLP